MNRIILHAILPYTILHVAFFFLLSDLALAHFSLCMLRPASLVLKVAWDDTVGWTIMYITCPINGHRGNFQGFFFFFCHFKQWYNVYTYLYNYMSMFGGWIPTSTTEGLAHLMFWWTFSNLPSHPLDLRMPASRMPTTMASIAHFSLQKPSSTLNILGAWTEMKHTYTYLFIWSFQCFKLFSYWFHLILKKS